MSSVCCDVNNGYKALFVGGGVIVFLILIAIFLYILFKNGGGGGGTPINPTLPTGATQIVSGSSNASGNSVISGSDMVVSGTSVTNEDCDPQIVSGSSKCKSDKPLKSNLKSATSNSATSTSGSSSSSGSGTSTSVSDSSSKGNIKKGKDYSFNKSDFDLN